jgi:vesicle transport through interaction with t-SNAREs 1
MDAFLSYEQDFKELRDSVKKRLENIQTRSGDAKHSELRQAQEELDDADEVLQSLRLAAEGLQQAQIKSRVKAFDSELAELKAHVRRAETFFGSEADRAKLFAGAAGGDLATTSADQRAQVQRDTERLKHSTDVIKNALRVAGETEQIGIDSLHQLEVQRETIQSSRFKIRGVDESLAVASRLMRSMGRRIMTNKLITMLLALIMIVGIVVIAWIKWGESPADMMMSTVSVNGTATTFIGSSQAATTLPSK